MTRFTTTLVALLAVAQAVRAEEFAWSWEEGSTNRKAAAAAPVVPAAAPAIPAAKEPFDWAAEKDAPPAPVAPAAKPAALPEPPAAEAPAARGSVDTSAYNDLLKENLALRRQLAQAGGSQDAMRTENERLAREVKDMEGRLAQFSARIDQITREKAAKPADPNRVVELETQLAAAERDKQQAAAELAALKASGAAPAATTATAGVQSGSDLFKQVERENAELKDRLARIEAEKNRVAEESRQASAAGVAASQEQQQLATQLAQAQAEQRRYKEALDKVMRELPTLERNLTSTQSDLKQKDAALSVREREIDQMKAELEAREQRLRKAARMLQEIAKARTDVQTVGELEKRDLHYNIAIIFARDGRVKDAENEYLKALRIDPNDASTHYNLAVLYDDKFGDHPRAVMHYRKYLALSPQAEDVDQVRMWILAAETKRPGQ